MTIHINSKTSGVPEYVYQGILDLGREFPDDWRVSLRTGGEHNDLWQLKLESATGNARQRNMDPHHQETDVVAVQTLLRELRDSIQYGR